MFLINSNFHIFVSGFFKNPVIFIYLSKISNCLKKILKMGETNASSNGTWTLNGSNFKDFDPKLIEEYMTNRKVDEPAYQILIAMYSLLILVGAAGNTLVVSTSSFY